MKRLMLGVAGVAALVTGAVGCGGGGSESSSTTAVTGTSSTMAPSDTATSAATSSESTTSAATETSRGLDGIVTSIAGNGSDSGEGAPGPALQVSFGTPEDVAVAPNGDVYTIDQFASRVMRVHAGQMTVAYAGDETNGESGFSGVAVSADGTVVFGSNMGIARLASAGTATYIVSRDAGEIGSGLSLAFDPDGVLYAASSEDYRVYRYENGNLAVLAGNGSSSGSADAPNGDGGPAVDATFLQVRDVAVGPDGTVYVADAGVGRVRAIASDGTIATVAGGGTTRIADAAEVATEGTPATELALDEPMSVAVDDGGVLYITDQNSAVIFRIDASGGLEAVIADVGGVTAQDGKPANETRVLSPGDIAWSDSTLYFFDSTTLRTIADV